MQRRKACAVLCTFSILSALFTGTAVTAAPEEGQTETATEQAAVEEATEQADTEEAAEESDTEEAETETESETEDDELKIDRDHPEGRIGVAYDQEDAWDELALANDDTVETGVNIRETADAEGEILGYLYQGCAAWILEKGEEWTEIYSGGMTGFVKNEYLVYGEDAKALAEKYGTDGVTAMWDGVAVFAEPDGESEVVKVLRTGDDMFLVADEGHWLTVKLDKENTAYVSSDDVIRTLVLDSAVPKSGEYTDVELSTEEETYEEETYVEAYEETYDDSYQEEYVEPEYTQPETSAPAYTQPETQAPTYTQPETQAPTYTQPETQAPTYTQPETSAPETNAPETTAPETSAPETNAPETSAPETNAPETSAPETDAPETTAPEISAPEPSDSDTTGGDGDSVEIGDDDGGWYDADTDTYYDASGNVVTQSADAQYVATVEEVSYEEENTYTEESYSEESYSEESYTDDQDSYTEESYEAYTDETYYAASAESYVEDGYIEQTEAYVEETEVVSSSSDDISLLAALIYCEAGNQSYEGMVAVGAVVMNRVYSSSFPNSISEVIYQSGQFTPASSGSLASALANGVPSSCYEAASAALAGENPVGSALYFNTGSGSGIQIGDHQFY
jgi:spore germination cell wall hydrolase CwlJ-like protein